MSAPGPSGTLRSTYSIESLYDDSLMLSNDYLEGEDERDSHDSLDSPPRLDANFQTSSDAASRHQPQAPQHPPPSTSDSPRRRSASFGRRQYREGGGGVGGVGGGSGGGGYEKQVEEYYCVDYGSHDRRDHDQHDGGGDGGGGGGDDRTSQDSHSEQWRDNHGGTVRFGDTVRRSPHHQQQQQQQQHQQPQQPQQPQQQQQQQPQHQQPPPPLPSDQYSSTSLSSSSSLDEDERKASEYELRELIGRGNFGTVHKAFKVDEDKMYVMKRIDMSQMSAEEREGAMKEVGMLQTLQHINIVEYKDSWTHDNTLHLVMSYCEGGDLNTRIRRASEGESHFSEAQILDWFAQICKALEYCHNRRIIHRDLKSQNIFLTLDGRIKLGDFGIARVLGGTSELAMSVVGTPYSMSPEVCENKPYSYASDVWSLGCVLYEMCMLSHAFDANNLLGLVWKIVQEKSPPIPDMYSDDLATLIDSMLSKNPTARPSVTQILAMPFIQVHLARRKTGLIRQKSAGRRITIGLPSPSSNRPSRLGATHIRRDSASKRSRLAKHGLMPIEAPSPTPMSAPPYVTSPEGPYAVSPEEDSKKSIPQRRGSFSSPRTDEFGGGTEAAADQSDDASIGTPGSATSAGRGRRPSPLQHLFARKEARNQKRRNVLRLAAASASQRKRMATNYHQREFHSPSPRTPGGTRGMTAMLSPQSAGHTKPAPQQLHLPPASSARATSSPYHRHAMHRRHSSKSNLRRNQSTPTPRSAGVTGTQAQHLYQHRSSAISPHPQQFVNQLSPLPVRSTSPEPGKPQRKGGYKAYVYDSSSNPFSRKNAGRTQSFSRSPRVPPPHPQQHQVRRHSSAAEPGSSSSGSGSLYGSGGGFEFDDDGQGSRALSAGPGRSPYHQRDYPAHQRRFSSRSAPHTRNPHNEFDYYNGGDSDGEQEDRAAPITGEGGMNRRLDQRARRPRPVNVSEEDLSGISRLDADVLEEDYDYYSADEFEDIDSDDEFGMPAPPTRIHGAKTMRLPSSTSSGSILYAPNPHRLPRQSSQPRARSAGSRGRQLPPLPQNSISSPRSRSGSGSDTYIDEERPETGPMPPKAADSRRPASIAERGANLRHKAISRLGQDKFEIAYEYYASRGDNVAAGDPRDDLKDKLGSGTDWDAVFCVEQLVFTDAMIRG